MPTPIPDDWKHHPEEDDRDAERFDDLCRLTEEVAYPIVQDALLREFRQTASAGAEILTEEAKQALTTLAADAVAVERVGETEVLEGLEESLRRSLPEPDEDEFRQHTREVSQMIVSAWLETLRTAQSDSEVLLLSDFLIPQKASHGIAAFVESVWSHIGGSSPSKLPQLVTDAIAWSAIDEQDAATVLGSLHKKLFAQSRLVDLPLGLVLMGAPGQPVFAGARTFFDRINVPTTPPPVPVLTFATASAQAAERHLSEPLAKEQYGSMAMEASAGLQTHVATAVQAAISTN